MRKVIHILRREYNATIRTKAFIIGLVIAPIMMGGSTVVFAVFKDRVDVRDKRIAVVDRSGLVARAIVDGAEKRNAMATHDRESGKRVRPAYVIEVVPPDAKQPEAQRLELSDRVRRGELHAFVDIGPGVLHPREDPAKARIAYHAKSPALDEIRQWIDDPVNIELRRIRLKEAGIESDRVPDLFWWIMPEGMGLVTRDLESGGIKKAERGNKLEALLLPLILPVLLFMLIMMGAQPLLGAVMEEKSQRIAEVLLGSVGPFPLMLGKLLSAVSVALTAGAVYVVGGCIVVDQMDLGKYVPYDILPWFAAHAIMAVFMFGSLFAALGSACNDASEAQAVTFPAMLPVIIPMFMLMPVVTQPQSTFATALSLFPLFTPMLMLIRQATPGGVPAWQPWVGLVGVALTTLFFVWGAGRIFRVGILMQGSPPKIRNLIRWAVRG